MTRAKLFGARSRAVAFGASFAVACGIAGGASLASPPGQTPWITSAHSKVRLVSGAVDAAGTTARYAGIQLRMDDGWKTYWRSPGDSGVPPGFDWSGSKNLKSADVFYPAPHRFAEASGTAIGYSDEVLFPVRLTPEREGEPIEFVVAFDYGLCMDLCIPNEVKLDLVLPAAPAKGDALLIESALARVPKRARTETLPRVIAIEPDLEDAPPKLVIEAVFAPGAAATDLFVEADGTFVPVPKALAPLADGKQRFEVTFASAEEAAAIAGKSLALTLVSDLGSSETVWTAE
ncbi:MAG: protein-disulfide reductase DsbD domain-containing protein [Methyloceanibacter sp.]